MCCCGGAVSALFCLWCQSGCRKGTVAGALTFFPPEPALYEFERIDKRGRILAPDEDAVDYNDDDNNNNSDEEKKTSPDNENEERAATPSGPLQVPETHGQTQKKMKSPVAQLTEQAAERRKRSKIRNARDTADAKAGVTFQLLLDPRLQVPPHDDDLIQAVKIPSCCGVHVAAVVYRSPRQTPQTKTIIYSHGNATDIGAMFPLQVVLATSLQINVVVFDYSGYGESGGVPEEHRTYKDIDAVFEFVWQELAGCDSSRIVLYGQSVGSGPCCYMAEKLAKEKDDLGGLILHSPFTSGMRVLTPSRYVFRSIYCVVYCRVETFLLRLCIPLFLMSCV